MISVLFRSIFSSVVSFSLSVSAFEGCDLPLPLALDFRSGDGDGECADRERFVALDGAAGEEGDALERRGSLREPMAPSLRDGVVGWVGGVEAGGTSGDFERVVEGGGGLCAPMPPRRRGGGLEVGCLVKVAKSESLAVEEEPWIEVGFCFSCFEEVGSPSEDDVEDLVDPIVFVFIFRDVAASLCSCDLDGLSVCSSNFSSSASDPVPVAVDASDDFRGFTCAV